MKYNVQLIPIALELLSKIKDKRIQKALRERIEKLHNEPEKQGKALSGRLKGYRSVRAVGQRYRIIYRVDNNKIVILIIGVGIRKEGNKKDVYSLLEKLIDNINLDLE
ncbi:MAG: type II toxin-antitoxin system RelE/ParE family toxin [Crocosphaera sp.]|nr:type II toxin-antitoxin system RelE/ParE family toxin [Crocosphaera sp.]